MVSTTQVRWLRIFGILIQDAQHILKDGKID